MISDIETKNMSNPRHVRQFSLASLYRALESFHLLKHYSDNNFSQFETCEKLRKVLVNLRLLKLRKVLILACTR